MVTSSVRHLLLAFLSSLTFFSFRIMFLLPGLSSQLNYFVPGSDLGELKFRRVIQQLW